MHYWSETEGPIWLEWTAPTDPAVFCSNNDDANTPESEVKIMVGCLDHKVTFLVPIITYQYPLPWAKYKVMEKIKRKETSQNSEVCSQIKLIKPK